MSVLNDDGLLTPSFYENLLENTLDKPNLELIGAYMHVIKHLRLQKTFVCHGNHKDPDTQGGCPSTCSNFDETVPGKEPCILGYMIQYLCDYLYALVNKEMSI